MKAKIHFSYVYTLLWPCLCRVKQKGKVDIAFHHVSVYRIVSYFSVSYVIIFHYIASHHISVYRIVSYFIISHLNIFQYIASHQISLYRTTPYFSISNLIIFHYTLLFSSSISGSIRKPFYVHGIYFCQFLQSFSLV